MLQSMAMTQLPIYSTNSITTYHPHRDFPFLIPALELDVHHLRDRIWGHAERYFAELRGIK